MLVEKLDGALLDYWVAMAGEEWKSAHHLYPTMTLDSTFSGVELKDFPRGAFGVSELTCVLVPRNPFRQDPQPFLPSTEWEHAGPIIDRELGTFSIERPNASVPIWYWADMGRTLARSRMGGTTHLIAAMRAFVASKFGEEVSDV